ncbi:MAG: hypothetical protein TH68_11005, partial [Candidatus Synechococcus spongiarum 142]
PFLGAFCLSNTPLHQGPAMEGLALVLVQLPVQGQGIVPDNPGTTKSLCQEGLLPWLGVAAVAVA